MDEIIDGSKLLNNSNTLMSIANLQSNTTISGGYVYINAIGFYFGNPALTGLSATNDNSIVVDKNGTRWIFQPQLFTPIKTNYSFQGQQSAMITTSQTLVFTGTGVILTPKTSDTVKISLDMDITITNAVTATITVATNPQGIAITPDGSYAYVANYNANTVSVISITNNGMIFNINYAAGTALTAAGTAEAGTAILPTAKTYPSLIMGQIYSSHIEYEITGLVLNTSYTFQPVIAVINGGAASFTQTDIWVTENLLIRG